MICTTLSTMLGVGGLALLAPSPATAQPGDYWTESSATPGAARDGSTARVTPRDFAGYTLDRAGLREQLAGAPLEGSAAEAETVLVPSPDGDLVAFEVKQSPVMESELAARHPEIRTYAGRAVEDPTATIRLDVTPMGFHASVRGSVDQAAWYVDPAWNGDDSLYLSYLGSSLPAPEKRLVEPELDDSTLRDLTQDAGEAPGTEVSLRTYRLALVTDPSYARYFGVENVLAEKVTLMNRVNQIYNDDLAIRMILINDTEKLNFDTVAEATGPNGPCGEAACFTSANLASCTGAALNRNRVVLGQVVGASAYDIGHLALGNPGGGVAGLGVVGASGKGRGCTGLPTPEGDFFAVDYVAHEMGHQFGGPHTFNGTEYNCAGNRGGSPWEPGSGTSIMAYAGICQQDNLQPHSDPYFSQRSITDISSYVLRTLGPDDEVQTVSLRGFNADGESFTLTINGQTTAPIVRGAATYNEAAIDAAIEAITGPGSVTVAPWGGATNPATAPGDVGFQVTFNAGAVADTDVPSMVLTTTSGDVTGFVGETVQGGPPENGGRTVTPTGNHAPVATAPAPKTIPIRTPFALTGSGTDAEGDPLVYIWEQNDRGGPAGTTLGSQTKVDGPLFRIFGTYAPVTPAGTLEIDSPGENKATSNPTRVFPDMGQVLTGNTNAATGTCPPMPPKPATGGATNVPVPVIECFAEWLPTSDYVGATWADGRNDEPSLNFRFTARDQDPAGGGYAYGDVKLRLDKTAGPFLVTSQAAAGATVAGGSSVPVTWAVNNTQVLAPTVRISASTDGGQTFGTVLAAATPNDGSQTVKMPNVSSDDVRIKVEAVDNYFFDVNDASFKLAATPAPQTTITAGPADGSIVMKRTQTFTYSSSVSGSTFLCEVDEDAVPCTAAGVTDRFISGTHLFSVAAVGPDGTVDDSPATRTFTVPVDDGQLVRKGTWDRRKAARAYGGDYVQSREKGAKLITRIRNATSVSLVVATARKAGTVQVFVGPKKVGTFSLKGASAFNRLRTVSFDTAQTGKLKVVVGKHKPVRVEGIAVVTDVS